MKRVIDAEEFKLALYEKLKDYRVNGGKQKIPVRSVTGPGRSGAVAAVYSSHYLGVPYIPAGQIPPPSLLPILIVDTAILSGSTIRKMRSKLLRTTDVNYRERLEMFPILAIFEEPPRVKFWYEREE